MHVSSECLGAALLVKWNVDYLARTVLHASQVQPALLEWKVRRGERADQAHCWVLRDRALRALPLDRPHIERPVGVPYVDGYAMTRVRYRPYLENCIVDASIFVAILLDLK